MRISAHVTEDFVNEHLGVLGVGCVGRSVYQGRLEKFLSSFNDLSYTLTDLVVDEARGAARYQMRFIESGKEITVQGIMFFEFRDELIAKRIDCWDGLSYMKQTEASATDIATLLKQ